MSAVSGAPNGHATSTPEVRPPKQKNTSPTAQQKALVDGLQVPFHPSLLQWRVVEVTRKYGTPRGRVLPYADKLAYIERLNTLVTPAGWMQELSVHTSSIVQRENGRGSAAKIVVTCHLTIHGLGRHSSAGEEWAANDNGATTAEAQAFKRACGYFGLGQYLQYFFRGVWIDVDKDGKPAQLPVLPDWATPDGWKRGARPKMDRSQDLSNGSPDGYDLNLVRDIEKMHDELGTQVYRGILKRRRIWDPRKVNDHQLLLQILDEMKVVERLMTRAAYACKSLGESTFNGILQSFKLKSVAEFGDVRTFERIVDALETEVQNRTEP